MTFAYLSGCSINLFGSVYKLRPVVQHVKRSVFGPLLLSRGFLLFRPSDRRFVPAFINPLLNLFLFRHACEDSQQQLHVRWKRRDPLLRQFFHELLVLFLRPIPARGRRNQVFHLPTDGGSGVGDRFMYAAHVLATSYNLSKQLLPLHRKTRDHNNCPRHNNQNEWSLHCFRDGKNDFHLHVITKMFE